MKLTRITILLAVSFVVGCATQSPQQIQRFHRNNWEYDWGYANEVQVGNLLYISGMCSYGDTMEEQVKGVYKALADVLAQHNLTFSDIVKENAYTTDIDALKAVNAIRLEHYGKEKFPSSTWVQVERLFEKEFMLEVEAVVLLK